jgi:hypothetical protein
MINIEPSVQIIYILLSIYPIYVSFALFQVNLKKLNTVKCVNRLPALFKSACNIFVTPKIKTLDFVSAY